MQTTTMRIDGQSVQPFQIEKVIAFCEAQATFFEKAGAISRRSSRQIAAGYRAMAEDIKQLYCQGSAK